MVLCVRDGASGKRANVVERVQRARAKVAREASFDRNVENHLVFRFLQVRASRNCRRAPDEKVLCLTHVHRVVLFDRDDGGRYRDRRGRRELIFRMDEVRIIHEFTIEKPDR